MIFLRKINKNLITILILFVVALIPRMWGIEKQFEVWDESTVVRYGEQYLNFWKSGDFSKESWSLNKEHPPFSKYFYGATRIVSLNVPYFRDVLDQDYAIGKRYTFQRMVSAFIGSLSVVLVYLLGSRFYNRRTGILAALILAFTPYFVAHSRVATQENLVTFLILLSTYLFFLALNKEDIKSNLFLWSGVVLGFAISTKYNAFFYLLLFAVLALINFRYEFLKNWKNLLNNKIIWIPFIAIGILIAIWPWLWPNPIGQFLDSTSRVNESRYLEYFLGFYPSPHPWYYFFVYFFVTTPLVLLLGLALFIGVLFSKNRKYDLWIALFLLTSFFSVASPLKMDGIRYIFPVYPALAIASARGFDVLIKEVKKYVSNYADLFAVTIRGLIIGTLVLINIIYHPYQWDYYNVLAGGPSDVYKYRMFDFGYWGEGVRSAFAHLNEVHEEGDTVYYKFVPTHVIPLVDSTLREVEAIEHADYVVVNPTGEWLNQSNYLNYDFPANFEIDYEEKILDAPIIQIYKRIEQYEGPKTAE